MLDVIIREMKIKAKRDTTTHSLECLKLKRLIPSVGRDVEQQEFAGGNTNWYNYFGRHLAVIIEAEYVYILWINNFIPGYIPNRNAYMYVHKRLVQEFMET